MRSLAIVVLLLTFLFSFACGSSSNGGDQAGDMEGQAQTERIRPGLNESNLKKAARSVSQAMRGLAQILPRATAGMAPIKSDPGPRSRVATRQDAGVQLLVVPESQVPWLGKKSIDPTRLVNYDLIRVERKEHICSFLIAPVSLVGSVSQVKFRRSCYSAKFGWQLKAELNLPLQDLGDGRKFASSRFWVDRGSSFAGINLGRKVQRMKVEVSLAGRPIASNSFNVY